MALELNQIKQILQKPTKRQTIQKAVNMQRRLRFHTETNIAVSDINQPTTIFLDWVRQLLPKDKYNIFLHLFKFPLPTPAVVEDVYRELERVFYSRNSHQVHISLQIQSLQRIGLNIKRITSMSQKYGKQLDGKECRYRQIVFW